MEKVATPEVSRKLVEALARVDRPGAFCTSGVAPAAAAVPGLEVAGVGLIGLPLAGAQATALKRQCEQAPYGKGTETLVDTAVRRVWRLPPDRFTLTNPSWPKMLEEIVSRVRADFGLGEQRLEAHPYELLLYERGSFFLPHRDGEKLDRMVATLVVVLPSAYEGGELVVRLEGKECTVDLAADNKFQTCFGAFYADCEHEVKPLRSGYRLCLVYNLTLTKGKRPLGAPRREKHIAPVADVLREWAEGGEGPTKLAVPMGHRYTQEGLAWDALKGVDRARADVLAEAAPRAGCQAHLALLTFWESGSVEEDGYSYGRSYGRRRRYDYYDDEEDEGKDEDEGTGVAGKYAMSEVFDSSLTAEHWRDRSGDRRAFGAVPVEREEVVPPEALTAVKPDEDFEGYTGNAGMTLDRWYRHAAIVLWPDARHFDVLCAAGSRQAVPALAKMVAGLRSARGDADEELKRRCVTFADRILAHWPENPWLNAHSYGDVATREDKEDADPLPVLLRLGEPELIRAYFTNALARDASLDPGKAIVKVVGQFGWATFRAELARLFKATDTETIERNVGLLESLCAARPAPSAKKAPARAAASDLCETLAGIAIDALERVDAKDARDDWRSARVKRAPILSALTRALSADFDGLIARVVAHLEKTPAHYNLRTVQLAALDELAPWLGKHAGRQRPAVSRWIERCRRDLEALTATAPEPPADMRREADISCKCADCATMKRFLLDPAMREQRFQMAEARRSHLQSNVRHCDVDCRTDKATRPYVLVCVKNTASYKRRLAQYHADLKHLETLRSLEEKLAMGQ